MEKKKEEERIFKLLFNGWLTYAEYPPVCLRQLIGGCTPFIINYVLPFTASLSCPTDLHLGQEREHLHRVRDARKPVQATSPRHPTFGTCQMDHIV